MSSNYTVLITNLIVAERSGTEVVVELLADGLRRHGHTPMILAPTLGPQAERIRASGHVIVDRLSALPKRPDVIHGHHNAPTMAAIVAYPDVPAIFVSHSVVAMFDRPPLHPRVFRYLAVSQLVAERCLSEGVPAEKLGRFQNPVDVTRFPARNGLPPKPLRALAVTKVDSSEVIEAACAEFGLPLEVIASVHGRRVTNFEQLLPSFDLVFATGRCALEAIAAGCAVILCDGAAFGGFVSSTRIDQLNDRNFGVSVLPFSATPERLVDAIAAYDPNEAALATARIRARASLDVVIPSLIDIYRAAIAAPLADSEQEALATAQFIEEFVPTFADRPWRALVRGWVNHPVIARLDGINKRLDKVLAQQPLWKKVGRRVVAALNRIAPEFVRSRRPRGTSGT